jgi:peptidoglycan/xylan/chitin deacetylase (PgdA/CDA1 family)
VEELAPGARASLTERLAEAGPARPRLETEDVRGLLRDGFEIGFHTLRHDRLPPLDDRQLAGAMMDGRFELGMELGIELTTISYPHGRADARVAAAAGAAGFTRGFVGGGPRVEPGQDPLLLPRLSPTFESRGTIALEIARHLRRKAA